VCFFNFLYKLIFFLKFGDALVTSIHCDSPINLVKLLLEKGADLAAKHPYWVFLINLAFSF
jgi:hypothetical protein